MAATSHFGGGSICVSRLIFLDGPTNMVVLIIETIAALKYLNKIY